jgi:hypothetical protein
MYLIPIPFSAIPGIFQQTMPHFKEFVWLTTWKDAPQVSDGV